jgi:integrase/recombinase XerD
MARNRRVCVFARVHRDGKQFTLKVKRSGNASIERIPDAVYWLRWEFQGRQRYLRIGPDHTKAVAAQVQQESFLANQRFALQAEQAAPVRRTLADAMEMFLLEKEDLIKRARWKSELDIFAKTCGKRYLDQIDRADIFKFMAYWKQKGSKPRTVFNRTISLGTFLRWAEVTVKFKFTKKGDIPEYIDPEVNWYDDSKHLVPFFKACTPEERMVFLFFLKSGAREKEVSYACWTDIDFASEGFATTFTVQTKEDFPEFIPKSNKSRPVPLDDQLVEELRAYRLLHPDRRLIFEAPWGGVQRHFLYMLKGIALRAGLNCGRCVSKRGKSCATHACCNEWTLHRFRRTWATMHLLAGVSSYELQKWIGHSDQKMLERYAAAAGVKSAVTLSKVNRTFSGKKF